MRLALIGMLAMLALPAQAAPTDEEPFRLAVDPLLERADVFAETEHYCLSLALYFEGGSTGESEYGQRHIARVVMERAKANRRIWGGNTICGVVFYQAKGVCQFSFACLPLARRTPWRTAGWRLSNEIAREALAGRNDEPNTLIRYYMQTEITPLKNQCRFRREFKPVGKFGRHEFFREPTAAERRELERTQFEACTKYEALLAAEKAKAEAAAAKAKAKKLAAKAGKGKKKVAAAAAAAKGNQKVAKVSAKTSSKASTKAKAKPTKTASRTRVASSADRRGRR